MKTLIRWSVAAWLGVTGTAVLAAGPDNTVAAPQPMSDAQMDRVAAGIANFNNLVAIDVNDVVSNNDVQVAVPVNAAVAVGAVGILSRQTGILTEAAAPGRLGQRQ